jgi:DNA-binding SARP family transcriptional activator
MRRLTLRILGDFEVRDEAGRLVEVGAKKNRALLATLALAPSGSMRREQISRLLWSDRADDQGRSSLRQALAALRKDLAASGSEPIVASEDRVRLDLLMAEVDALAFRRLAASADIEELRAASALYRGELLADVEIRDAAFEQWVRSERRRFADLEIHVLEKLWPQETGPARLQIANRLVALDPLRESAHRTLMQAYAEAGERSLALRQYES